MNDLRLLSTPAALVELPRLLLNLDSMQERAEALGVRLRPHFKTHKCLEIARLQLQRGATGMTASTLHEVEVLASHGFDDVTWAFPVPLGTLPRIEAVAEKIRLGLVVDSREAVRELEQATVPLRVWLKVDCGYHRAGVDPEGSLASELVERIHSAGRLEFAGLLTHSGHAYEAFGDAEARAVAEEERSSVVNLAGRLRSEGLAVPEVSVGSTPAMTRVVDLSGCTEARPGNYAFFDFNQVMLGACVPEQCALSVLATVVSSQRGSRHCVCDAGALALSKDLAGAGNATMGEVWADHDAGELSDDLRLTGLSQEHGKLSHPLPVGERARILPNHSCLAAACFDEFTVVENSRVVDRWKVWRGRD